MKVKKTVLDKLDTNKGLGLIMMTLDCSASSARNYVNENAENGDLTKTIMVRAIASEFGLSEPEILEEVSEEKDLKRKGNKSTPASAK